MRINLLMNKMEEILEKIQKGVIPNEDRELLEVLVLTGMVRKNDSIYEITEKGLEFLEKPIVEN